MCAAMLHGIIKMYSLYGYTEAAIAISELMIEIGIFL
jgi:hypothetical protein